MKISDRALGYISLVALICVFAVIAYSMWEAHHEATSIIEVDFDELGTLQPEDQVVVRGYTVGTIGTVRWLGDRARVQIKFDQPMIIREGTQFNNINYALMGQRRLEIVPSKTGKVLPEDYIHQGHFEPGIAEMLRHIENVNSQIEAIREMVHLVIEGDSSHASAEQLLNNIMTSIEGTLESAETNIEKLRPALNQVFAQVKATSEGLVVVTHEADSTAKAISEAVNGKIAMADSALRVLSEGAKRTNDVIDSIESNPLYAKILQTTETIDKVNELVVKINELVKAIDTKGLKVLDDNGKPVELFTWKNINLIGDNARDKARARAQEAQKSK